MDKMKKAKSARERMERLNREGLKSDGRWDRRVIRHPDGSLAIHEVHYAADGSVKAFTNVPSEAVDPQDGLSELMKTVEFTYDSSLMAISKAILDYADLPGSTPPALN